MRILIKNDDDYAYGFITYSVNWIRTYGTSSIDRKKLIKFDEYFNELFDLTPDFSTYNLIVTGFQNLVIVREQKDYIIEINQNMMYRDTQVKLETLCKLVDQGNLELTAYPIFTDTFQHYCDHLKEIKGLYKIGGGQ